MVKPKIEKRGDHSVISFGSSDTMGAGPTESYTVAIDAIRKATPEAHFAAIGRVASEWAYFEALVDRWCISIANVSEEIGVCFTAQSMGSRVKLEAFIALIRHRGVKGRIFEELDRFAKKTQILGQRRNRVVHDPWFLDDPEKPVQLEATASKILRLEEIEVPTHEIDTLRGEIVLHQMEFEALAQRALDIINALPPTSPGIPSP